MSDNLILQKGIDAPACGANIDALYGPYNSVAEAYEELINAEGRTEGATVGVFDSNGKVTEYWLQQNSGGELELVKKTLAIAPASTSVLGGVMTTVDDPQIDAGYFDTYIDSHNKLHCVVPTFKGSDAGLVPAYDGGGGSLYKETMFLNSKGNWASAFSENSLAAPLYLDSRNNKVSLDFTSSFGVGSSDNKLYLKQATESILGGIRAGNWTSIPSGYSCYEAKFGNNTEYYDQNDRGTATMSDNKLYVVIPDSSGEGVYYTAGEGIGISNANYIYLKTASSSSLGGIKADTVIPIEDQQEIVPINDPDRRASIGITDKYVEIKKGVSNTGGTDPQKLYVSTQQILSVVSNRNTIGQLSEIDITDYASGTDYSLVFDSEYSRTTNEILVLKAGNYITIQGKVDSELHLEDVGSYSDSEFPATTYVLVKTDDTAKFYFSPYNDEAIQQRDRGYLLKDTATVSKADFIDSTYSDSDKIGMACESGYYLLTIFGNILQIDKLADKRDID